MSVPTDAELDDKARNLRYQLERMLLRIHCQTPAEITYQRKLLRLMEREERSR